MAGRELSPKTEEVPILQGSAAGRGWQPMETAPKDRDILVRRHNDCGWEHYVVWWRDDPHYPWRAEFTAYPSDRLDGWHEIPR